MAYYDYNGTITIDENAARADINRIQSAIPKLTAVSGILERMIQEGCSAQGETALAIVEKAGDLNRQVSQLTALLREESQLIQQTVARYQLLDQQVKQTIGQRKCPDKEVIMEKSG